MPPCLVTEETASNEVRWCLRKLHILIQNFGDTGFENTYADTEALEVQTTGMSCPFVYIAAFDVRWKSSIQSKVSVSGNPSGQRGTFPELLIPRFCAWLQQPPLRYGTHQYWNPEGDLSSGHRKGTCGLWDYMLKSLLPDLTGNWQYLSSLHGFYMNCSYEILTSHSWKQAEEILFVDSKMPANDAAIGPFR